MAGTVKSFLSVVISGFFITGSLKDLETDFDPLNCCLKDTRFLFGLRPFSRKICCLDFRKKVTILWKTTTDVIASVPGVSSLFHLSRSSLLTKFVPGNILKCCSSPFEYCEGLKYFQPQCAEM